MHRPTISLALILFAFACGPAERREGSAASAASRPVTVKGSDTMVILGQRFAEEYMRRNPGTVVQINGGGSGTGIAALINGTVEIAQSSRPIKDVERKQIETNRSSKLVETPVALDALAVFVNQSNPLRSLTIEQLAGIFTGKVTNWRDLGGPNARIVLYGRESSSGTYDYFKEHVLRKADFAPSVQTLQGTAAIINAVSKDPNGIGYGGIAYGRDVRALAIKADPMGAPIEPGETTVADGSYPLSRKLFFYNVESVSDRAKSFVQFAVSPDGQAVVKNVGYFPLATTGPSPDASQ